MSPNYLLIKISIAARPGQFTRNARANMFLSWQTYEGIQITVHSSIELIKYLLSEGVPYVLTERFLSRSSRKFFWMTKIYWTSQR